MNRLDGDARRTIGQPGSRIDAVHVGCDDRAAARYPGDQTWFMANARAFLARPGVKSSCLIDYIVPSNDSSVDLARSMAADINAPFVFPNVDDLYSFDGSHLVSESSERWATAFVKALDPSIDNCLGIADPEPRLEAVRIEPRPKPIRHRRTRGARASWQAAPHQLNLPK